MNKHIIMLCLAAISFTGYSQELSWFQGEQTFFYEVKDCVPESDVKFYKKPGRGKIPPKRVSDWKGVLTFEKKIF